MQVIIPMAGQGTRFRNAGYNLPKTLIEVEGKPIIEHVIDMFPGETNIVFIVAENQVEENSITDLLKKLVPTAKIAVIPPHKLGPVHTVAAAFDFIDDNEPVTVNYCDFSVLWDYENYKRTMASTKCDGCVTAYRGFHPHSLGNTMYAYMREKDNYMLEIREKEAFTDNRMNEYASAGTYYFRTGALLKKYYDEALKLNMTTNGEFYASLPYNLMARDGLKVYIYELEKFLQWGTPEDLEEYLKWSDYFLNYFNKPAERKACDGVLVMPAAGEGIRFRNEGYTQPKPLVDVAGVPMIKRTLESFPLMKNTVAVLRKEFLDNPEMVQVLQQEGSKTDVITVEKTTEGQACTCMLAEDKIDPEKPLHIIPCDSAVVYNEARFRDLMESDDTDAVIWTFRNHPNANRKPKQYGWVLSDGDKATGISCKIPLSETPKNDPGIVGAFSFKKGKFFTDGVKELIRRNLRTNGEFYVDTMMGVLIEQNLNVKIFDVTHYLCFGVPDDVRTFEYWEEYFRKR
ncbi:MAG: NTP transferase domain-containing protein [Firmicutes bacterium]|nr:NTP transferase domain-containing protein [Bacillota bacterium]